MSLRLEKFRNFCHHPIQKKLARKLTEAEFDECVAFIEDHEHLDRNGFVFKVNRWKLDQPKTRNHVIMWNLLVQVAVGCP